jgi:prepilin-type N-terminal cleavage/methylation domain-containing protein
MRNNLNSTNKQTREVRKPLLGSKSSYTCSERGFTLIELILAFTILTLVASIGYSLVKGILRTREVVLDRKESRLIAGAVLNRLTREIQLAHSGIALMPEEGNLKNRNSRKLNLRGVPSDNAGASADTITFLALEGGQYLPDGGGHSGLVQISYALVEDPERPPETDDVPVYSLVRTEIPYLRPFERAYKKKMVFPVTHRVISLRFLYYDAEEDAWYNQWGEGEQVELPGIVKFRIEIKSPSGRIEKFETSAPIRSQDN